MPVWLKEKLFQKNCSRESCKNASPTSIGKTGYCLRTPPQPRRVRVLPLTVRRAMILTLDGVGEWTTTTAGIGNGSTSAPQGDPFPASLGLLYSAFTYFTGFKVNSGEYKVMGLAPYGVPRFVQPFRTICSISSPTARSD